MKRYKVVFEDSAQNDIRNCYDWGCRNWGKQRADHWIRSLRVSVLKHLATMPKGFPLAPEDEEFSEEIRHMVLDRYRILFTTQGKTVHVLHLRGAYFPETES